MSDVMNTGFATQVENSSIPEPDDFRADVLAAYQKVAGNGPEQAAAPAGDEDSSTRLRNERGQFSKPEGADDSDAGTNTDADEPQVTEQEPSPAIAPPKGWSADAKAKWAALDPSIQAEVAKREADIDNGGRQWSEQKRFYEEALSPIRELAKTNGVDERTALTRLAAWQNRLQESPYDGLIELGKTFGIDLTNPNAQQTQRPQTQSDPRVAELSQTVSHIAQTLEQREQAEIRKSIEAFASSPGHEHFEKVKVTMGKLMEMDPNVSDMETAYQKAIWLDDEVRAKLLEERTNTNPSRDKERQQVDKARKAAGVKGSGPTGTPAPAKKEYATLRETIEAAYRGEI